MTNKIKAAMSIQGVYQSDIAKALNVTQGNVSRVIKLGDKIRISELKQLVATFGGTVEVSIVLPDGTKL